MAIPIPKSRPPRNRKKLMKISAKVNFNEPDLPNISRLIGPYGWLIFKKMGMIDCDSVMWLNIESSNWPKHEDFKKFERFIRSVPLVNDASERSVQLISNYESYRQDLVLATCRFRSLTKNKQTKQDLSIVYSENLFS